MAQCPICDTELYEYDPEWIDEEEELFQARCEKCGWRGSVGYGDDEILYDYRTDKEVPSDPDALAAWREENSKFYNV